MRVNFDRGFFEELYQEEVFDFSFLREGEVEVEISFAEDDGILVEFIFI